jgi:hypothetical protein
MRHFAKGLQVVEGPAQPAPRDRVEIDIIKPKTYPPRTIRKHGSHVDICIKPSRIGMFWVIEGGSNGEERMASPGGDSIPFPSKKRDPKGGIYFVEWRRLLYAHLVDLLAESLGFISAPSYAGIGWAEPGDAPGDHIGTRLRGRSRRNLWRFI